MTNEKQGAGREAMNDLREKFEKHVEATSFRWVEQIRSRLFEKTPHGQYAWPGLESRFVDFQAGHALALEANAKHIAELEASLADAIEAQQVLGLKLQQAEADVQQVLMESI